MFADDSCFSTRDTCHIMTENYKNLAKKRTYPHNYRMVWAAAVLILLILLTETLGILYRPLFNDQKRFLKGHQSAYMTVEGYVAESKKGQSYCWAKLDSGEWMYIMLPYENTVWYATGTRISISGNVSLPNERRNPGGFDESAWLRSKETALKMKAEQIIVLEESKGIWRVVQTLYHHMEGVMNEALSENEANLALALLTGAKHLLDDDFYAITQQMGIAHIFAVSGLHVGIIGSAALFLFRQCGWERGRISLLILSAGLILYCMLAGLPASSIRAAAMILLSALAIRLYRPANSINFLAFAAVLLLLDNPFLLWNAGFQLSFGVTLSLLLFVTPISRKLWWISIPWLRSSVSVVLAAWIGSVPLSAWHFYTLSLLSPIYNFILVPVVSLAVPLLLIAFLLAFLCPVGMHFWFLPAKALLFLLQDGTLWLYKLTEKFSIAVQWNIGRPPYVAMVLYLFLVILLYNWLNDKTFAKIHRKLYSCMIPIAIMIVLLCIPSAPDGTQLLYLDTGQGSSAVLRTEEGEVIVFDTGAKRQELASVLAWYGVNHVDAVILSHSDTDHINGLNAMLMNVTVGQIYMEQEQMTRDTMQDLLLKAKGKDTAYEAVSERMILSLEKGNIILESFSDYSNTENRTQLTAMLYYGDTSVAFPGDLAVYGVQQFLKAQHRITIWTVPHHGSKYSGSQSCYRLLKQKGVKYAVISAGQDNHYGHPHQEVLNWLNQAQISYDITAEQGALLFYLQ